MSVIVEGRPDFSDHNFGVTEVKKFPAYVYSQTGNSCLIHKIAKVTMRWYEPCDGGNNLQRREKPAIAAITVCGVVRFLTREWAHKPASKTCAIPKPEAILCGRCHGEPATFGKMGKIKNTRENRKAAHLKLGCVAESNSNPL